MNKRKKQCYFCETSENVNCRLYVGDIFDGRYVPKQVDVCKHCKAEYENCDENEPS